MKSMQLSAPKAAERRPLRGVDAPVPSPGEDELLVRVEQPPHPLDAAILFAPVGALVPPALESLDRGGVLAIAER